MKGALTLAMSSIVRSIEFYFFFDLVWFCFRGVLPSLIRLLLLVVVLFLASRDTWTWTVVSTVGSSLRRGDDEDSSSLQSTVFHMHVIDIEVALDCRHNAPSAPCSIDSA